VAAGVGSSCPGRCNWRGKNGWTGGDFLRGFPIVREQSSARAYETLARSLAVEILTRIARRAYAEPPGCNALQRIPRPIPRIGHCSPNWLWNAPDAGSLDWIIAELYRGDAGTLEPTVRNILRTGLYQLRYTDRIPPFAAVNEAVGIARNVSPAARGS
jgi:16S rRNA (cytosine967-C5)-methyltransferase